MTPARHDDGPPVTDAAIGRVERGLGVVLPDRLRAFYLSHNGGWPKTDETHPLGVHGYIPIGDTETSMLRTALTLTEADDRLAGLIPFAYDAGGDIFLTPGGRPTGTRPVLWPAQENHAVTLDHSLNDLLPPLEDPPSPAEPRSH